MENLRDVRRILNITHKDVSDILGTPLRTIESWESGKRKTSDWVMNLVIEKLLSYEYGSKGIITKEKGIYNFDQIKAKLKIIPLILDVHKIIIFGSYATSKTHELSDIDIVIDTSLTGFSYFELFEYLQKLFMKTVDLVRFMDLDQSSDIFSGIKHKGILIYKQK